MKIGLFPLSAKPYHKGHHEMVELASAECDEVVVFVSLVDRKRSGEFPILGSQMKKIWTEELLQIMPSNVEVRFFNSSPVKEVYNVLIEQESGFPEDTYVVYCLPEDLERFFSKKARAKWFPHLIQNRKVQFRADSNFPISRNNISGTRLRHALKTNNFEDFLNGMPLGIDSLNAFNILKNDKKLGNYV